jgi:hypothetical protein
MTDETTDACEACGASLGSDPDFCDACVADMRRKRREQFLADIITGAVEGGTGYWATVVRYKWQDLPPAEVHAVLVLDEDETDAKIDALAAKLGRKPSAADAVTAGFGHMVNVDTIAKGLSTITAPGFAVGRHTLAAILLGDRTNDAGEIDSDAADVIVQAALFGEIVYG